MSNRNLLIVLLAVILIAGLAYALGVQNNRDEPQNLLGNLAAGVSDKIDQASHEIQAESSENSANGHFDAAKEQLGIKE